MKVTGSEDNPIKRRNSEKKLRRDLTLKAFVCILLTNFLTYSFFNVPLLEVAKLEIGPNERIIKTPIINMASDSTLYFSLYDEQNNLICRSVQIIRKLDEEFEGLESTANYHLIKIQSLELPIFISFKNKILHAYPRVMENDITKGVPYEVEI